jgi:hypothetical protein
MYVYVCVCVRACLRKGAPTTNLCTVAITRLLASVLESNGMPGAVCAAICGAAHRHLFLFPLPFVCGRHTVTVCVCVSVCVCLRLCA